MVKNNNGQDNKLTETLDQQLKKWLAKNPTKAAKVEIVIKEQAKIRTADTNLIRFRMNNLSRKFTTEQELQVKYKAEQRKKLADCYKTPKWQRATDKIPSRGNGL